MWPILAINIDEINTLGNLYSRTRQQYRLMSSKWGATVARLAIWFGMSSLSSSSFSSENHISFVTNSSPSSESFITAVHSPQRHSWKDVHHCHYVAMFRAKSRIPTTGKNSSPSGSSYDSESTQFNTPNQQQQQQPTTTTNRQILLSNRETIVIKDKIKTTLHRLMNKH